MISVGSGNDSIYSNGTNSTISAIGGSNYIYNGDTLNSLHHSHYA